MLFSEIAPRSKIIVIVTNGSDLQARFVTKVMRNMEKYILAIPFRHKGLRINFEGKNVKINMEVRDANGDLWSFKGCRITTVKKDGLLYHKIISGMSKGIENRRGGRRFHIWEAATFYVDGIVNPVFTTMRDIGPIGFSFVIDNKKKIDIKEGTGIKAFVKNHDGIEIELEGIVVRRENLEKYIIYGCKMENPSEQALKFIKHLEQKSIIVDAEI